MVPAGQAVTFPELVLFLVHGALTARKLITATADQRFIDGYPAGALAEIAQASFANPGRFGDAEPSVISGSRKFLGDEGCCLHL